MGFLGPVGLGDPLRARLIGHYVHNINDQGGLPVGLFHQEVGGPAGAGFRMGYVRGVQS